MRRLTPLVCALLILAGIGVGVYVYPRTAVQALPAAQSGSSSQAAPTSPEVLDRLLAPIALYPDQLLAQMLLCAMNPASVTALNDFLGSQPTLKGTELQDAVLKSGFEPSFVALALFPQVVSAMAANPNSTTRIGQAFTADKGAVFASIQRLRKQAHATGNLKSTPQQQVETQTTSAGEQVIVIEPANPQVVYVPQYNSETIYVQPAPTTVIVQNDSSDADAAVAGVIGFTAGIAIGASMNNNYYYGPYGWHGGVHMYNDAWDDWADHREDARDDWMDHREDVLEDRGERREDVAEQRGDRRENVAEQRGDRAAGTQEQRTERQQTRQENGPATQAQRGSGNYESRGVSQGQTRTAPQERSGTRSDAFSGYSSGRSERAASSRGTSSRASAGASRSRSGGGRRR